MATFRVRIELLRFLPNIPAGMDPCVLLGLVPLMRKTGEDHPPIKVRRDGDGWLVRDGRHRAIAAIIGGRPDVLATDKDDDDVEQFEAATTTAEPVEAARPTGALRPGHDPATCEGCLTPRRSPVGGPANT